MAQPDFNFHGFAAQGLVKSADSEFVDDPSKWSLHLTEAGINGRVTFNDKLQFVAQGVYLDGGNRFPDGTRIDYAFFDYALKQSSSWTANVHLGRYKNLHWFHSATQDVPHTRPSAILPQSVYFDGFRDVSLSSDGVAFTSTLLREHGDIQINWSLGKANFPQDLTRTFLGNSASGDAEQRFVHQFSVYWTPAFSGWHLGISWLDTEFTYDAQPEEFLTDGESMFSRYQISARYSAENFELTSELLIEDVEIDGIAEFAVDRMGYGGYLQGRYFVSPELSAMLRYDTYYLDKDDRSGNRLSQTFGGLVPNYAGYMHTYSVGVRWDIAEKWRLQAEHHWVEGSARLDPIITPTLLTPTDKHWRIVALQLMTWF
jgi:hypothetical protein